MSAAERVLEGRFVLGADDAAYLQTGLATLWSTAATDTSTDGLDKGLALAPPGLYTPDAVGGIREGLVRALKAKTKTLERNAPADLAALVPALRLLLETSQIRDAVTGNDASEATKLDTLLQYITSQEAGFGYMKLGAGERVAVLVNNLIVHRVTRQMTRPGNDTLIPGDDGVMK